MAKLAEEQVEEWLNRQGYFTIRGVKLGVDEMDLLAMKISEDGTLDCRHIEVQASMRPVSYISQVPKEVQKQGRAADSAKRTPEEFIQGVKEWVEKKYNKPNKIKLLNHVFPKGYRKELVINTVKNVEEVDLIQKEGIAIINLSQIINELRDAKFIIPVAAGGDFVDLLNM